ncbi:MAG: toll/interleukin-1 receptor domain-containing protein [Chloroflexi bacterium]|nr:toll/interleukin-1 receptor domain-containing protein [Chloroflexota bacterium]
MDEYYRANPRTETPVPEEFKYDVFLSHSRLDDELARAVKQLLEHNGLKTFTTPASISSAKWLRQIELALQGSREIWLLLTGNALNESIWAHHEYAYFYGFHHGQGLDLEGARSRYLFEEGTPLPGLYGHIQGLRVDSIGDPVTVAKTIAEAMGIDKESFMILEGFVRQIYPTRRVNPPELRLQQRGSQGQSATRQTVQVDVRSNRTIYSVDVIGLSTQVSVGALQILPQIPGGEERTLQVDVSWRGDSGPVELPIEVTDTQGRTFRVAERPRDQREGDLLIVTFETEEGIPIGAVTYFTIRSYPKRFPEFSLVAHGAPFGWINGQRAQRGAGST